jgi:hypothetical protein
MGILDLLGGQKAPQPAYQPPAVPASDPTTFALEQFTKGKATPEQKQMVSKLPAQVVSDAVSKRDAEMFKIEVPDAAIPSDILDRQRAAKAQAIARTASAPVAMPAPVAIPQVKTPVVANQVPMAPPMAPPVAPQQAPQISPPQNMTTRTVGLGTPDISPTVPTQASGGAVPPTVVSGAIVRDTATKGGPEAANAVAQAMDKPVTKEQAVAATDAVDKFLKDNPDGGTLANILDVVGVALSAYGGTQRETMLQQRNKARMALSQQQALAQQQFELQQALAQQGYGQQEKMAGISQINALALAEQNLTNELAIVERNLSNQQIMADKNQSNLLLAKKKDLENQLALIEPQLKASKELALANAASVATTSSGGHAARVSNWTTPGGN